MLINTIQRNKLRNIWISHNETCFYILFGFILHFYSAKKWLLSGICKVFTIFQGLRIKTALNSMQPMSKVKELSYHRPIVVDSGCMFVSGNNVSERFEANFFCCTTGRPQYSWEHKKSNKEFIIIHMVRFLSCFTYSCIAMLSCAELVCVWADPELCKFFSHSYLLFFCNLFYFFFTTHYTTYKILGTICASRYLQYILTLPITCFFFTRLHCIKLLTISIRVLWKDYFSISRFHTRTS